jgi:glycosyltransferase involved in cell wall biosynthesis
VALAAKNGERFLVEQVVSILPQLRPRDQLIISVDPSEDTTAMLARGLAGLASPIITLLEGPGQGVAANFQHALRACEGDIIFLSDQDDIWMEDKVFTVLNAFAHSDALLICHDAAVVDEQLELLELSYFTWHRSQSGFVQNLLRNSYVGCCMALRRELLSVSAPFPPKIPMHDQWLGLCAERYGSTLFLECPLILYRRHGANATNARHATIAQMFTWRVALLRALLRKH